MSTESVMDQTQGTISGRRTMLERTAQMLMAVTVDNHQSFFSTLLDLELTMAQARGLLLLAVNRQMTIGQFSEAIGVGKSSGSALIDRLVERGLVARSEGSTDRRYTQAELTGQGRQLVEGLRGARHELVLQGLSSLSDSDLDMLQRVLGSLADVMNLDTKH